VIAPLSTGASHTVLGLAGAAVGMLVVWIAGCALAPARPPYLTVPTDAAKRSR